MIRVPNIKGSTDMSLGRELRLATEARRVSLDNFNKAIRDAYESGITQWQIAEVVGLTQARVSQIVNEAS